MHMNLRDIVLVRALRWPSLLPVFQCCLLVGYRRPGWSATLNSTRLQEIQAKGRNTQTGLLAEINALLPAAAGLPGPPCFPAPQVNRSFSNQGTQTHPWRPQRDPADSSPTRITLIHTAFSHVEDGADLPATDNNHVPVEPGSPSSGRVFQL